MVNTRSMVLNMIGALPGKSGGPGRGWFQKKATLKILFSEGGLLRLELKSMQGTGGGIPAATQGGFVRGS